MAKTLLERMRERVAENKPSFERDLSVYPFFNMDFNQSSIVRILPYENSITGVFWAEKMTMPMSFIDPENEKNLVYFNAPCREMYDPSSKCPVAKVVTGLFSEVKELRNTGNSQEADRLEKIALSHWKKRVYYFQGFVEKDGIGEQEVPDNPIRIFPMTKKLFEKVYNSVFENEDDPFEKLPAGEFTMEDIKAIVEDTADEDVLERIEGNNFVLKKLKQGEYADWITGSGWVQKRTPLSPEQIEALHEYGMHDLTKRLPERPTDEVYDVLAEMMEASIARVRDGEAVVWDPEWTKAGLSYYRNNRDKGNSDTGASASGDSSGGEKKFSSKTRKSSDKNDALAKLRARNGVSDNKAEENTPEPEPAEANEGNAPEEKSTESPSVNSVAARIRARAAAKSGS